MQEDLEQIVVTEPGVSLNMAGGWYYPILLLEGRNNRFRYDVND